MTKEQVIRSVSEMSAGDREDIAFAIWPGVASEWAHPPPSMEPQQFWAEMERRIAAHEADPNAGMTWNQLKAQWAAER